MSIREISLSGTIPSRAELGKTNTPVKIKQNNKRRLITTVFSPIKLMSAKQFVKRDAFNQPGVP